MPDGTREVPSGSIRGFGDRTQVRLATAPPSAAAVVAAALLPATVTRLGASLLPRRRRRMILARLLDARRFATRRLLPRPLVAAASTLARRIVARNLARWRRRTPDVPAAALLARNVHVRSARSTAAGILVATAPHVTDAAVTALIADAPTSRTPIESAAVASLATRAALASIALTADGFVAASDRRHRAHSAAPIDIARDETRRHVAKRMT